MSLAPITEEQRIAIEENIGYDEKQVQYKLAQMKDWMQKQPHLPKVPESYAEKSLHAFLVGSKLRTERAKYKFDSHYALRHQLPEIFQDRDPSTEEVRKSVDIVRFFPLSELTPSGNRVYVLSCNLDEKEVLTVEIVKSLYKRMMAIWYVMLMQGEFSAGVDVIFNGQGFLFSHIANVSWSILLKFTTFVQEGMPYSVKKVYCINTPKFMDFILNIVNPVLSKKVKSRIQIFEGGYKNLHQFIPTKILPSDMGGEAPCSDDLNRAWQKTIESMRDLFIADEKLITDESRRPKNSANQYEQPFGINGSFSMLTID